LLSKEPVEQLAREARTQGDPARGAVSFYQVQLGCAKCHRIAQEGTGVGPDLAQSSREITDSYLVESLLTPSKVIKKGYESITISTKAGRLIKGVLVSQDQDVVKVRDPNREEEILAIAKKEVEELTPNPQSAMPDNLVNQLSSRQEFLDLVRYLMEISEKGPKRVLELRPGQSLVSQVALPPYERNLDHAGIIREWNDKSYQRGLKIYTRVCASCHGTLEQPGSLPTAAKFATHQFKNGSDPHGMYQTLTRGFGMMTPQTWMTPRQKYDVIHYIRETYLKAKNPSQYASLDQNYLAKLPQGTEKGPEGVLQEPWVTMDYGPVLHATFEIPQGQGSTTPRNPTSKPIPLFAHKGMAIRLDPGPGGVTRGSAFMLFDHDTMRMAAAWTGPGFMDYHGINFDGQHQVHPKLVGSMRIVNPNAAGWANPQTGQFDEPRQVGRDGKRYGPLPRSWAHFKGVYHFGPRAILSYSVGDTALLESPGLESMSQEPQETVFTRTINLGPSSTDLLLRVASSSTAVAVLADEGSQRPWTLETRDGFHLLRIQKSSQPARLKLLMADAPAGLLAHHAKTSPPPQDLSPFLKGGPKRWPETVSTRVESGPTKGPFAVDVLRIPDSNPWLAQMRLSGLDFFPEGDQAAVCTWDGDVWRVKGLQSGGGSLQWQRIATGLFQPLGLKIHQGEIYVCCRDQIVRLKDLNGDGEADFYETFNNDHQVTEHFHEFAMGLQTDKEGNFYYAKAARHALKAVVPHHGTLLKVTPSGERTEILATGFRAPNGVCLNGDGTFFLTDQEGFWLPKNRINHVKVGSYHGNFWGYHAIQDSSDQAMEPPLCWVTNAFDRSPSEMLWVDSDQWGPLKGSLLNFSYGYGKVYVVTRESVDGVTQGGMCELPIPAFPTGVMRARFHPRDGQLYCCGLFAWAGNQTQPGGFYRVRYTGQPVHVPVRLEAKPHELVLGFSGDLDPQSASEVKNYQIKTWSLKRSAAYGSKHYDEKPMAIASVQLDKDGKTVVLKLPDLEPTWCMEIQYRLRSSQGSAVEGTIHNTIHRIGKATASR